MIIGIGTDVTEVSRIAKNIENNSFKEKVFSKTEITYCETKANKAENYAVRFAAKEAFFKALGTGLRGKMAFNEVEVINDQLGKPSINILGITNETIKEQGIRNIHLSLSHTSETAIAVLIIEG